MKTKGFMDLVELELKDFVAQQQAAAGVGEGVHGDWRGLQRHSQQVEIQRRHRQLQELIGTKLGRRNACGNDARNLLVQAGN